MCLNALIPNFEAYVLLTTAGDVYNLPTVKGQEGSELHSNEMGGLAVLTSASCPHAWLRPEGAIRRSIVRQKSKRPFIFSSAGD